MYFLLLGRFLFNNKKLYKTALIMAVFTVALCLWSLYRMFHFRDSITFFNVGEGDSILLVADNGMSMLVDGGPSEEVSGGLGEVLPPLASRIDVVVATHLHADHITGLLSVLRRYDVGVLLLPVQKYESPVAHGLLDIIKERQIKTCYVSRGDSVNLGDVKISVVWPDKEHSQAKNINDSALLLLIDASPVKVLLTSDVELGCDISDVLRADIESIGSITLLKVPHQGSGRALCKDTLSMLGPKIAVIPVGKNNYGHPSENTLRLLESLGIYIVRTDINGNATMDLGAGAAYTTVSFW